MRGEQRVRLAAPLPIVPDPDLYAGPVHVNARGSVLIACAVHAEMRRCGSEACDAPSTISPDSNASSRHERLCHPYHARYVHERRPLRAERSWHSTLETETLGVDVVRKSRG